MDPADKRRGSVFLASLAGMAVVWSVISYVLLQQQYGPEAGHAFFQIFFIACLDLLSIIMIVWKLIFSQKVKGWKSLDILLWFVFKLVCLAFLAITLKRLTNAPLAAILLGVGFMGAGPIIAKVFSKLVVREKN
ncbi:MAG: hypothetical protein JST80_07510 [Bdellovibrionales bacterium]|nr:hypothetical protein [Bdellovibrionales bacterium]